jgi:hypothetical protein
VTVDARGLSKISTGPDGRNPIGPDAFKVLDRSIEGIRSGANDTTLSNTFSKVRHRNHKKCDPRILSCSPRDESSNSGIAKCSSDMDQYWSSVHLESTPRHRVLAASSKEMSGA